MASNPNQKTISVKFAGGSMTGAKGLIKYFFGIQDTGWGPTRPDGKGKRPYGSRQRANARAGEPMFIQLLDGSVYSVRITGTQKTFVAGITSKAGDKIQAIWSRRGTAYGEKLAEVT